MQNTHKLPFFTLLLMISFASVNAVLFTPALPDIAKFFDISHDAAEHTISWYLIGYACGQLIYGPLANRFGRKPAIYAGVSLQIISSFICVLAGVLHMYSVLLIGRLMLALGSGVGLKMTFTLVNECHETKAASKLISYLVLAFAITPGLAAALGGFLNTHFGWMSCFYAGAVYGFILLILSTRLPETLQTRDYDALKLPHLIDSYAVQFKNSRLVSASMMMGTTTSFVYVFAAIAPFIAINVLGMNSAAYGSANIIPSFGLAAGSLISAKLTERYDSRFMIGGGLIIATIGVFTMLLATSMHANAIQSLFIPMMIIYFGLSAVLANASGIAMSDVEDKSHAAAVMSFINMGVATVIVLTLGFLPMGIYLLPSMYIAFCGLLLVLHLYLNHINSRRLN